MQYSRVQRSIPEQARSAFSLAELVVAIGVLVLTLALAGQVMSITVRATGQATAFTNVSQAIRALERTLRDDLSHATPGRTVLLIQGNPINAYWTTDERDADDDADPQTRTSLALDPEREDPADPTRRRLLPPRADMLMFFTARPASNYVPYTKIDGSPVRSVTSQVQQVVYGHADLGDYVRVAPGAYTIEQDADAFPEFPKPSPVPASRWHLARRVVHLLPSPAPPTLKPGWVDWDAPKARLDLPEVLVGETDVVGGFDYERWVVAPPDSGAMTTDQYPEGDWPHFWPMVFHKGSKPFARSLLDPTPPATLAERLGHYFIPGCASFKVEWTLDPRAAFIGGRLDFERDVLWIDPGHVHVDPNNAKNVTREPLAAMRQALADAGAEVSQALRWQALNDVIQAPLLGSNVLVPYTLAQRFGHDLDPDNQWRVHEYATTDRAPNLAVFTATRRDDATGALIAEEVFPTALRITVDVMDEQGRLPRPIRHVMVIPVGQR